MKRYKIQDANKLKITMTKLFVILIFSFVCILYLVSLNIVNAQTGNLLNFTGKVTALDGAEVADGAYDFTYRLFTTPSEGTAIWTETLSTSTRFVATVDAVTTLATSTRIDYSSASASSTLRVGQYLSTYGSSDAALISDYNSIGTYLFVASSSLVINVGDEISNKPFVEGGVIAENLGAVTDISNVDFSQTLYLEVEFNGEIMRPRKLLTASPVAFNALRFGGKTESEYATLDENEIVTGEWNFNNIVDIATSSSQTALTVTQNGSGNLVEINRGATTSFAVLNDGRVQFENYTFPLANGAPGYILKATAGGQLEWAADYAGGFGVDGKTLWATSSDNLLIYPIDASYITVLGNNSTSTLDGQIFEVEGSSLFDLVNISSQQELRFYDADNSNYMSLRASSTLSSNYILTLPADAGTDGLALVTDGTGNLRWASSTGGVVYVNAGTQGQIPYYATGGSLLSATSSLFISDNGYIGIGTTTPAYILDVNGDMRVNGNIIADNINTGTTTTNYAQVKTVAKSGADYITIQAAIDALTCSSASPCLVRVMPGVYAEQITINNKSYIDIVSSGGSEVTKINPSGVSEAIVISGSSGNVRVEGFEILLEN